MTPPAAGSAVRSRRGRGRGTSGADPKTPPAVPPPLRCAPIPRNEPNPAVRVCPRDPGPAVAPTQGTLDLVMPTPDPFPPIPVSAEPVPQNGDGVFRMVDVGAGGLRPLGPAPGYERGEGTVGDAGSVPGRGALRGAAEVGAGRDGSASLGTHAQAGGRAGLGMAGSETRTATTADPNPGTGTGTGPSTAKSTTRSPKTAAGPETPTQVSPLVDTGVLLPEARPWAAAFIQAAMEVTCGLRPSGQLIRWTTPEVHGKLVRRGTLTARALRIGNGLGAKPRLRALVLCSPRTGVCEVSAVIAEPERVRAVAFRMEGLHGRWRVTELEIG